MNIVTFYWFVPYNPIWLKFLNVFIIWFCLQILILIVGCQEGHSFFSFSSLLNLFWRSKYIRWEIYEISTCTRRYTRQWKIIIISFVRKSQRINLFYHCLKTSSWLLLPICNLRHQRILNHLFIWFLLSLFYMWGDQYKNHSSPF